MEILIFLIILLFAIAVPVIFGCVCAHIAGNKGRNKVGYFFLGFFFFFIGVIIVLLVDDLNMKGKKRRVIYEEYEEDND